MALAACLFAILYLSSRLSLRSVFATVVPIYVIVGITVVLNSFVVTSNLSDAGDPLYPVIGDLFFTESGCLRGCFFGVRILLLVWMSLVVCYTTTSTAMTAAFASFLSPLRRFGMPVDDIAMVFSIALRFIPETASGFFALKDAQWSRGADFDEGNVIVRVRSHCAILIPLFIELFRKADDLAMAMDARCYGMAGIRRTSLRRARMGAPSVLWMITITIFCIALAILA